MYAYNYYISTLRFCSKVLPSYCNIPSYSKNAKNGPEVAAKCMASYLKGRQFWWYMALMWLHVLPYSLILLRVTNFKVEWLFLWKEIFVVKFHGFANRKKCALKILTTNSGITLDLKLEISFKRHLWRAKISENKIFKSWQNPRNLKKILPSKILGYTVPCLRGAVCYVASKPCR